MTAYDLVLRAPRVATHVGEVARCIGVRGGRVAAVAALEDPMRGERVVELDDDEVLLPGLVDTHVHINEPGRTKWEGFASATRAAAAGGVTTLVDMPLNCIPPTVDVRALELKRAAADGQCHVDVGFWGGALPGNDAALRPLHDAGVFGFKCFLLDSGVAEFPPLNADELATAMRTLRSFDGLLLVHAEDADTVAQAPAARGAGYADFLGSRPHTAEDVAVTRVVELARVTGARVHVLHLSSANALPILRAARRDGVRVTVETCPHYLFFAAEDIPVGATAYKCCPPIRAAANRELLWEGLADGTIDCVVSDHSPCTPDLKRLDTGDFGAAWGGIASLQLGLPAVWTTARARGHGLADVVRWMAEAPAQLVGLASRGRIAVGCDADFCVFAPDEEFVVDPTMLHHRHPVTPYAGHTMTGVVRSTWLRGELVTGDQARGRLLERPAA
jgi:allantoinase